MPLDQIKNEMEADTTLQMVVSFITSGDWLSVADVTIDFARISAYMYNAGHDIVLRQSRIVLPASQENQEIEIVYERNQ